MLTLSLKKLMLLSLCLVTLTGCQEEEFFEKDVEGAITQNERDNKEDDLPAGDDIVNDDSDDDNDNNDDDDDTNGDDDDTNGDDDDTNGDDDDTNGDDDDTNGDDDDTNGDDDDTNGDDDDTNGDDDDTNGDDDDTNGDDDDDDDTDEPTFIQKNDSFTQSGTPAKTDILWVVDNSGSMADEQAALADNFSAFIEDFATQNIDFQMAITTTDRDRRGSSPNAQEQLVMSRLNSTAMSTDSDQFIADFQQAIKVGIRGSGIEKGLKSSEFYLDQHNTNFLRQDAFLAIVYVSDERDQSGSAVADHLAGIQKWKSNNALIRSYSIVDMDNTTSSGGILKGFQRYQEMSELTNGFIANINSNFHNILSDIGSSIVNLTEEFPLSMRPFNSSELIIKVNGVEVSGWDYIEVSNTIKFRSSSIPADGSTIEVTYNVEDI